MRVVIADKAGACYGVARALQIVERVIEEKGPGVYTLGPLIHNPKVIASLEQDGVRVVEDPREARTKAFLQTIADRE